MARTGLFYLFSTETSKYNVVSCFLLTVFKVLVHASALKFYPTKYMIVLKELMEILDVLMDIVDV